MHSTALVTGGGQGLGLAIGARLVRDGYRVILGDVDEVVVATAASQVGANGVRMDVTDNDAVASVLDDLAGGELDVLVNNAGIISRQPAAEYDSAQWDRELAVNLGGVMRCCRGAFGLLVRSDNASVINLASVGSRFGLPQRLGYSTTKSGVLGLTRTLAAEWGPHGIRVNAIAPGYIETQMMRSGFVTGALDESRLLDRTPLGRFGTSAEVAAAASFLASQDASFITGITLRVDGGITVDGSFHARPHPDPI